MAKEEPKVKVKVSAIPEKGFRRIGIQFGREPQEIDVTAAQLEILKAEKNLVVVDALDAAPDDESKKGKK